MSEQANSATVPNGRAANVRDLPYSTRFILAASMDTAETELLELATDWESAIRERVVDNPASSANVLARFSQEENLMIIAALLERPTLPAAALQTITKNLLNDMVEARLLGAVELDMLNKAYICLQALSHPNVREESLRLAIVDPTLFIREGLAAGTQLSENLMYEMLKTEKDVAVVRLLLANPKAQNAVRRVLDDANIPYEGLPGEYVTEVASLLIDAQNNR